LDFGKEFSRQSGKRIGLGCLVLQNPFQKASFLRRYAQALATDGIEAADRIADRHEAARKQAQSIETAPYAGREGIALESALQLGVLDGVVDRLRPEPLGIVHKSVRVGRRPFAELSPERHNPAVAFDWQHIAAAAAFRRAGVSGDAFPIG